jgi:mRNA interferase YafQ
MRQPVYSGQFKRDIKRAEKRGKDLNKLKDLVRLLIAGRTLPARYKDHALKGGWTSFRDAHIEPDWLMIYKIDGNVLRFERTGTHADLFDG